MKGMDMKSRIELELRGKDPESIKDLNLDSCRGQQIDGLTEDFKSLEILSLINVGLTSLKGFPKLFSLKKLELSDNRIMGGLDHLLGCSNLTHLNLSGNRIKDIDTLAPLAQLKNLRNLDLFNCEVTQINAYRENVFNLLPNLKFLDGFDKSEQEEDEYEGNESDEDEEGDEEDDDDEDDDDDDDDDDDEEEDDDEEDFDDEEDEDGEGYEDEEEHGVQVNGASSNRTNGVVSASAAAAAKKKKEANYEEEEDDDDDDDEDDDEEEADESEVGLSYLQRDNLDEDDNDEDFDEE